MNLSPPALIDLFDGSLNGDMMAYRRLLTELTPVIRHFVRGQLRHNRFEHLTEDIVQDSLMAIHLKLHTYERGQNPLPWVYTIARYKMIDQLRRQKSGHVSIDDENYVELPTEAHQDSDALETHHDLNNLLNRLEPPQGDIIRALKVEGASIADLSAQYGYSESKIKIIIHRGLKKLNQFVMREEA